MLNWLLITGYAATIVSVLALNVFAFRTELAALIIEEIDPRERK